MPGRDPAAPHGRPCSHTPAGPPIAWYPGRLDALAPGPTHPAFSTRLPMGGFGPAGGEWALLVWRGWKLYVQAGWGGSNSRYGGIHPPCSTSGNVTSWHARRGLSQSAVLPHPFPSSPSRPVLYYYLNLGLTNREAVALTGGGHSIGGCATPGCNRTSARLGRACWTGVGVPAAPRALTPHAASGFPLQCGPGRDRLERHFHVSQGVWCVGSRGQPGTLSQPRTPAPCRPVDLPATCGPSQPTTTLRPW